MTEHLDYMEIRWKNFKSFKDTKWIKIKPLTIILGPNNVGKTNLLAPLVLMSQTMNSRDAKAPLIISGKAFNGGSYEDIVHNYDVDNDVFFGFRYHIHKPSKDMEGLGSYSPGAFEITIGKNQQDKSKLVLKKNSVYDIHKEKFFTITKSSRKKGGFNYKGIGKTDATDKEIKAIQTCNPVNYLFSPNSILFSYDREEDDIEKSNSSEVGYSKGFSKILSAVSYNYSKSRKFLGGLSFIGPMRESPKRMYEVSNENQHSVGITGENMASILRQIGNGNKELNKWISKFGFGDEIKIEDVYSNYYAINFYKKGFNKPTSLPNTGFGVSQVLPLIIQALAPKKNSITIAEQPEIHLNPKLQSTLAELFVTMANNDQTVIVETHSEHLLLRLRTLIAKGEISNDDVALYFVDKEDDISQINSIQIEKDGHIKRDEWPKEFFDDALNESINLANEQISFSKN